MKSLVKIFALLVSLIGLGTWSGGAVAAPAWQASSVIAASTGADVTVTLPTHAANDILLLQVVVRDVNDTITWPNGWAQIATVDRGTAARYWWAWKRAASNAEPNPLVNKSGATGDTYAAVTTYRGAITTGDPWEVKGTPNTSTAAGHVLNGITTLTADSLIVASLCGENNSAATGTTFGATNPAFLAQVLYVESSTGSNGACTAGAAARTTIGATGNVTATWTQSNGGSGGIVLALKPVPPAEYRFDETSGSTATDSSVNSLNGTLTSTPTGSVVPLRGAGKICNGYYFNGSSAYVSVPDNALLDLTNVTVMAWVRHNAVTAKLWEAIVTKGDSAYRLHLLGQTCSLNTGKNTFGAPINTLGALTFGVNAGCNAGLGADVSSGIVPVSGTWYHVVGTYDGATSKIYVDGTLQGSAAYAGTIASNTSSLYIGENAEQTGRYWSGDIDEVKIFSGALTAAQISAGYANESAVPGKNWDGTARVCAATGPDHYELSLPSTSITCLPTTVTVTACANNSNPCNSVATGVTGTASLTTTGGTIISPATVTAGVATTTLSDPSASAPNGTKVTVTLTSASPVATNAATCRSGGDCSVVPGASTTFNTAGFIFDVPHHVSEVLQTVNVSAVKTADNSLACVPAFAVSKNVMFKCSYANPASGTLPVRVNGTALNAAGTATGACDASGNTVSLAFDATGVASTTFQYADVGNISLTATYTGSGTDAGLVMTGSDSFIAAPKDFLISAISAGPIKAGNNFSVTVTARNNASAATPNFGKESTPAESASLTHIKYQPTGSAASNGIFSGTVGAFNSGAATAGNLNWSEVGTIDLTATLASSSYLGSGLPAATGNTGAAGAVGPFIPDHFITSVADGCTGCGFTYSGQPFTVTVTAMNGLTTPTKTFNYDGSVNTAPNFAKAVTLTAWDAATGTTQNPGGSLLPAAKTAVPLSAFVQGVATLNTDATKPFFTFTTVPTAPASIKVRAAETATPAVNSLGFTEGSTEIRSGRIRMINNYGSELLSLPIQLVAQYWANATTGWVNTTTDSTTSFVVASPPATSAVSFSNFQKNLTTVSIPGSPVTITLASGRGGFTLSAPGTGHNGSVDLSIPALTGASCETTPVLLGCYLPSLSARATFGIYKSPLIYRRENY